MILEPSEDNIKQAADTLQNGGLVAFPTETVYGLGANALDSAACKKIYELKGRPARNPLVSHVSTLEQIMGLVAINSERENSRLHKLAQLWPGPLTVVLSSNGKISSVATAGGSSIAVRIPQHPIALKLISTAGIPIAAPSANRSNYISPTTAKHVSDEFGDLAPTILDGGPARVGIESTIISIIGEHPTLLRPGYITLEDLREILGEEVYQLKDINEVTPLPSPGLLEKHYSPATKTIRLSQLNSDNLPTNSILVSLGSNRANQISPREQVIEIAPNGDLAIAATALYSTLRDLDQRKLSLIIIDECDQDGIGAALMDRISRATA